MHGINYDSCAEGVGHFCGRVAQLATRNRLLLAEKVQKALPPSESGHPPAKLAPPPWKIDRAPVGFYSLVDE